MNAIDRDLHIIDCENTAMYMYYSIQYLMTSEHRLRKVKIILMMGLLDTK